MNKTAQENDILVSFLLPAYNYPEGIQKILDNLQTKHMANRNRYEVIISDNSTDDRVKEVVSKYSGRFLNIKYVRPDFEQSACLNWNYLISLSVGKFFVLMHHDEFPLNEDFVPRILSLLNDNQHYDIVMMNCVLVNKSRRQLRPHVPEFIRRAVLNYFPSYLYKRNVVGPTASLVVKKELFADFDCELIWLIDVDQYVRIRKQSNFLLFDSELTVASYIDRGDSITSSLGNNITHIRDSEYKYLLNKYPNQDQSIWFRNIWLINLFESSFWNIMRVLTRLKWMTLNRFNIYSKPTSLVERAFDDNC